MMALARKLRVRTAAVDTLASWRACQNQAHKTDLDRVATFSENFGVVV